jgi:hypothetical protein
MERAAQRLGMYQCPSCLHDQLYRVPRTTLERLFYIQSYECRMCGHRSHVPRRPFAAAKQFLISRHIVRITNGPDSRNES